MIGVDCEMCETDIDPRALIGVSVVDEEGGVLLKVGA
jgi:RNA exonuclease 1